MANDFRGSFAEENVTFQTVVSKTTSVGDNFWKAMIFVEATRFIADSTAFVAVAGSDTVKVATVDSTTFASVTNGLLQSWLTDLFASGFLGECYLVSCGANIDDAATAVDSATTDIIDSAYELLSSYGFHKTILIGATEAAQAAYAAYLADKCLVDKELFSSPVLAPYTTATPETLSSDVWYEALKGKYAILTAHQDTTRNGSLLRLGLALAGDTNSSGTVVGNQMGMIATGNITASGIDGTVNTPGAKTVMKDAGIGFFKPVGDNSGNVACQDGLYDVLNGDVYAANWVLAYCTYMVKVKVARLITSRNFRKNANSYGKILDTLTGTIGPFGASPLTDPLKDVILTAPAYGELPTSDSDVLTIPNAWEATYVDVVRKVQITGTLYIGA